MIYSNIYFLGMGTKMKQIIRFSLISLLFIFCSSKTYIDDNTEKIANEIYTLLKNFQFGTDKKICDKIRYCEKDNFKKLILYEYDDGRRIFNILIDLTLNLYNISFDNSWISSSDTSSNGIPQYTRDCLFNVVEFFHDKSIDFDCLVLFKKGNISRNKQPAEIKKNLSKHLPKINNKNFTNDTELSKQYKKIRKLLNRRKLDCICHYIKRFFIIEPSPEDLLMDIACHDNPDSLDSWFQ